jgi:hypothetical protein
VAVSKKQKESAIHKAIKDGVRLTDEQVAFAGKQGIPLWGSVNAEEHERAYRKTAEWREISRMSTVDQKISWEDHMAYQNMIYDNGWNQ